MEGLIQIGIFLTFLVVAMLVGSILEHLHFKSIRRREVEFGNIALLSTKQVPANKQVLESSLVQGATVVSVDYFKRFLASWRCLFGGEVKSYVSLVDRGRREAVLRMKAQCLDADMIVNLKIETSSISQGQKKQLGSVEVLAYGTAVRFAPDTIVENS